MYNCNTDTGSDVTIISKTFWLKIGMLCLKNSQMEPRDAATNNISKFDAMVLFNNTNILCNILVSSIPDLNLFGSDHLIEKL